MLESLEQNNIKRMSVEEPEKKPEVLFDPETEISEKKWEDIKRFILFTKGDFSGKKLIATQATREVVELMNRITLVSPKRSEEFLLTDEEMRAIVIRRTEDWEANPPYYVFYSRYSPSRLPVSKLNVFSIEMDGEIDVDLRVIMDNPSLSSKVAFDHIADFRYLFPNKKIPSFESRLEFLAPALERCKESGDIESYVYLAAAIKLMFPTEYSKFNVDPKYVKEAKELFASQAVKNELDTYLRLCLALSILSADEVRVTSKGFEFIQENKKKIDNAGDMPEQRNF